MNKIEMNEFVNQFPISKTIRFELKPYGASMENLIASNLLGEDKTRAEHYVVIKKAIDDFHRKFINEMLENTSLDWYPLAEAIAIYEKTKEDADRKMVVEQQKEMRKLLMNRFREDLRFKDLFSKKMLSDHVFKEIESSADPHMIEASKSFTGFSEYFKDFHKNRENVYSLDDIATSIAHRAISVNFKKHCNNCIKYKMIQKEHPEIISEFSKDSFNDDINLDRLFSIEGYNDSLTQWGIDRYNRVIGSPTIEGRTKIKGLNEYLNIKNEDQNGKKKIKLDPLYKQILSNVSSFSFLPKTFESDKDLMRAISEFYDEVIRENVFERAINLLREYSEYDLDNVFVRQQSLSSISQELFGSWDVLGGLLQIFYAECKGDPLQERTRIPTNKKLSQKQFRMSDIIGAMSISDSGMTFDGYVDRLSQNYAEILESRNNVCLSPEVNLSGSESAHVPIKELLDDIQRFMHLFGVFNMKNEIVGDPFFYSEYDELYQKLFGIVPLYDMTRNYVTKKEFNTRKIKLKFGNPTLANGWDLNKERDNTAVIFVRDKKYYLGVMNPNDKIKSWTAPDDGTVPYRKMVYKLLPGPNKMLPKVFFSKKNINYYAPSDKIMEGYKKELHKKGDKFDIDFCHKLIDFFKESIYKHPDWKEFGFEFTPTDSYKDIGQFYREVEKQGYKVTFADVPASLIDEYVHQGKLFLFQLYTKDFSDKSKGEKNLHTLYWEAAFSEENLKDVAIKINGEAELFYREKSEMKKIVIHRKGDLLIGRTTKDCRPIPEHIYREIVGFKKGLIKSLSEDAQRYMDGLRESVAPYDIIKDRRYTMDKMYFHIPLSFNFNSQGEFNINRKAMDFALSQENLHIIGIDRGERNLIYVSVINRKGEVVDEKSFNVVGNFDYHEKLRQREKERDVARKNWNSIEKISDLKEGYLSAVIHEICKLMMKYNAIIVMEDLNYGFKRGRFKIERQVYQKFEKMLIDKLNYLAFKGNDPNVPGGVLKAYQFTNELESFSKLGKQSGFLFYVPAAYTSKIDSDTGFVNLFNTSKITTIESKINFVKKMESIRYDVDSKAFAFSIDYDRYEASHASYIKKWTIHSMKEWPVYDRKDRDSKIVNPTQSMFDALKEQGIEFEKGQEILSSILNKTDTNVSKLFSEIYQTFMNSIRMRYTFGDVDKIISPVYNRDGRFFETGLEGFPKDADANGAYNIARKGELLLRLAEVNFDADSKKVDMPKIELAKWLEYVQKGGA